MSATTARKQQLGQFFTTSTQVQQVMRRLLRSRHGRALEPSAGAGDLVRVLERRPGLHVTAVELDRNVTPRCRTPLLHDDFFRFARHAGTFQAILGNPPYVAWKAVTAATRRAAATVKARYSDKVNLYVLFMDRCIDLLAPGGEMVLIVPKEWLYSTSAAPLREKIAAGGAITHLVDCGEAKLFADADVPALTIFRYRHAARQGAVRHATFDDARAGRFETRELVEANGAWLLLRPAAAARIAGWGTLGDQFAVHVGLVTGLDDAYRLPDGMRRPARGVIDLVTTRREREAFIDVDFAADVGAIPPVLRAHLEPFKTQLLGRRIARFDERNWWRHGAVRNKELMASDRERFYALAKTRSPEPFFTVDGGRHFSGGVLGVFRRDGATISSTDAVRLLNSAAYRELLEAMSLTTHDKVTLQPATLERAPFPRDAAQLDRFLPAGCDAGAGDEGPAHGT